MRAQGAEGLPLYSKAMAEIHSSLFSLIAFSTFSLVMGKSFILTPTALYIELEDPGVGIGAPHYLAIEHIGHGDISQHIWHFR